MPIYEYKCEQCGNMREVMQKISEKPLTVCQGCGGSLKKMISSTSFVLKGSGWYVTDYADKSGKSSKKEEGAENKEKADSSVQKEINKEKTESTAGIETKKETKSESKTSENTRE